MSKSSGDATITCVGLAEDAFERLRHIAFEGEHVERMAALGVRTKLSPGVLKTLMRLSKEDGVSMGEMARAIGCDPSYVTALVDDLDDRGLARREAGPGRPAGQDRRPHRRRAVRWPRRSTACSPYRLPPSRRCPSGAAPTARPVRQGARGGGCRVRPEWNRGGDAAAEGRGQDRGQRDRQSRGQRDRQAGVGAPQRPERARARPNRPGRRIRVVPHARDRRRGRDRRAPVEVLRRRRRRARRQLRRAAGRGVRPARPQRRRQDHDRRDPRGFP